MGGVRLSYERSQHRQQELLVCRTFQALWRTRTATPPYHGGFGALLAGTPGALALTFFLQIGPSLCVLSARACPRVPNLMYLPRTRAVLSVCKTTRIPARFERRDDSRRP
jgi:hypothetical protein